MIIKSDIEQGSTAWHELHGSVPTASCFSKIITTKGDRSKQRKDYMLQLAGTRVFGVFEDNYQSWHMERGLEREKEAKELYTLITGNELVDVGFCYHDDDLDRGCSPDGLINDDGVFELKSPMLKTHCKYILDGKLPTDYFCQVQGELYITGLKWAHFVSYFPGTPMFIVKVERDEKFISKLASELDLFVKDLESMCSSLRSSA